ncbi:unnamed protein product [Larinioides sclopetarius]|uniref:Retrotransposon gag domain-containing protein n=1 Tax=Larinioides sclopetarius TaxID=280406 RepID=A0AAV1ZIF4_9ARAC
MNEKISENMAAESQTSVSYNFIPFDPNNNMKVDGWLKYFNDKCTEYKLDEKWKLNNIASYLKNNALTEYINVYSTIKTWEEVTSFLQERFISPSIVNLIDFTSKLFTEGEDLKTYFQDKLKLGRQLNLSTEMILEGLSDGLPVNLKQILSVNSPNNPTKWLIKATKLMKLQTPYENQNNPSNSVTQNLKTNFNNKQGQPSNFRPHNPQPNYSLKQNFRPHTFQPNCHPNQNFRSNNYYSTPPPKQNFRPSHSFNSHFQNKLPPSPCWLCTNQGIANAYHWVQTCPFGLSAGQTPPQNPAPSNFDPLKEETKQ